MKKLAIALGALACVFSATAASVVWNSGNATAGFLNPDGAKITAAMGYTMNVYFYSDALGTTKLTQDSATVNGFGAFAKTTAGDDTASPSYFDAKGTYYIEAIVANSEYTRTTGIQAFTVPDKANANVNFTLGTGFATESNKWGDWQAVPEPTSGLLLLCGLGALALRRKKLA